MSALQITVTPADGLIDEPRRIVASGAEPGEIIEITAQTQRSGVIWQAHASFRAGANGRIDLTTDEALEGSYTGIDGMGLVWSQSPVNSKSRELFNSPVTDALITTISARGKGCPQPPAVATLTQRVAGEGVTRREVREDGLVGTLYMPAGVGPFPAVMILNGSGGGINEHRAALYASRGYAAFALAYFKAPGLSDYISNTPLEYFQKGMQWLRRTVQPKNDFVAINGQSRGGELVLLLGATFPQEVNAVIAYVPSAYVHSGQNACDPKIGREGPTWLLDGKPLRHWWEGNRTASWKPFDEGPAPHRHDRAMRTALQDPEAIAKARIPVENINGPVVLLSGTDDGSWPSDVFSKIVHDKLTEVKHPHDVQWLNYEDAGHSILFPYVPTTQHVYAHPVSGMVSTSGGNNKDNARADAESWPAVLRFLQGAVEAHAKK